MKKECIAPDSSFYICFTCDLKRSDWTHKFAQLYSVYVGKRILNEIFRKSKDEELLSMLHVVEVDYYELMKPYFGRNPKHLEDGEYEAIGIAHFLEDNGCLNYLIIDDIIARKFVNNHFPYLTNRLVGTVGLIRESCCITKKITNMEAMEILNSMVAAINQVKMNRPCSMDINTYKNILIPIIEKIKKGCKNG